MYMTSWSRNTQGYVLVIVMGLLAALGVMALALGAAARVDLAQTRRFQDETVAELLAKAGIDWTIHYLNTVEQQGTLWQAPWTSQVALFQGRSLGVGTFDVQYADPSGTLHYGLQDEEARVNLNSWRLCLALAQRWPRRLSNTVSRGRGERLKTCCTVDSSRPLYGMGVRSKPGSAPISRSGGVARLISTRRHPWS
jgi:type II secretory pathway component PulK